MRLMLIALVLAGCDNMARQLRPHAEDPARGTSTNDIVSGAANIPRAAKLETGDALPFALTPEVLARGADRYAIACVPCHGALGDGGGPVSLRGFAWVPSFHTPDMRREKLSHFYNVITFGFGAMPAHAAQLSPEDRWKVAAYIRALQLSQHAALADVPESERAKL